MHHTSNDSLRFTWIAIKRQRERSVDIVLINVHTLMEEEDKKEKEYFYATLANVIDFSEES